MSGEKDDKLDTSKKFYVCPVKFLLPFKRLKYFEFFFSLPWSLWKYEECSGSDLRDLSVQSIYTILSVLIWNNISSWDGKKQKYLKVDQYK